VLGGIFKMNDQQWDEFLREVDLNKNGVIEFDEFEIMMQNLGSAHDNRAQNFSRDSPRVYPSEVPAR
jgi:hypothetical protein